MERNRYADFLRVVAVGGVVYGHWLLVSVTYRNGQLSGLNRWITSAGDGGSPGCFR
jgi:hypothetical protein